MKLIWRLLKYLPPSFLTFIKRHSNSKARLWIRQKFGAGYEAIPDQIWSVPDGRKFHIGPDFIYWPIYMGLDFEPEPSSVVRQLVRPGDIVVDVGANFGWYTTLFAQAVDTSGRVFAFEPVPSTHARLTENLELNQLQGRVTVVRSAVADAPGTATVYVFKSLSHACSSLSTLNERDYQAVEAPLIKLDEYLSGQAIERVDFLKCDVEGAELAVLRGCGDLLRSPEAPIILVELNEKTLHAFGYVKDDIWRYLSEVGYDHFYEIASSGRLRRITQNGDIPHDLLLCAKNGKVEERLKNSSMTVMA